MEIESTSLSTPLPTTPEQTSLLLADGPPTSLEQQLFRQSGGSQWLTRHLQKAAPPSPTTHLDVTPGTDAP